MSATTFPIVPLLQYQQGGRTSIKRPRELAFFSYDDDHRCHPLSAASLRYYYPPWIDTPGVAPPEVNLSGGYEAWIKASPLDHHLNGLLETLCVHEASLREKGVNAKESKATADIVTWRGIMTKILTAPEDQFSDFELNATYYDGTIYIEENHEYKVASELRSNNRSAKRRRFNGPQHDADAVSQDMMQYWGYKFEELCVLKKPWAECTRDEIASRDKEIVNNNAQFCSIARTGIGSTSLIIAGEVDCVLGEKPEDEDAAIPWVELKTAAEPAIDTPYERDKFERKLLKYWAQSFLLNVPTIVVGFRTPDGTLTRLTEFETQKIPRTVKDRRQNWDGDVCIRFTALFLEFLKETIAGQEGVWRIRRKKDAPNICLERIEDHGTGEILLPAFKLHREKLREAELAETGTPPDMDMGNDEESEVVV